MGAKPLPPLRRNSSSSKSGKNSKKSQEPNNQLPLILGIGGGVVIVGLIAILAFQMGKNNSTNTASQAAVNNTSTPATDSTSTNSATPTSTESSSISKGFALSAGNKQTSNSTVEIVDSNTTVTPIPSTPAEPVPPPVKSAPVKVSSITKSVSGELSKSLRTEELSLPDLIDVVEPSVVRIETFVNDSPSGVGSGYVVSEDGIVVTNHHVMARATSATASFRDGSKTKVLGYYFDDHLRDICIIKIEIPKAGLKPVTIAKELPRKGIAVVAFGAPLGLSFTASDGAITAIRDEANFQKEVSPQHRGTWLQTDAPISPGNSGGPLTDMMGNVVGMNTLQITIGQNLNFAISCVEIRDAIESASGLNLLTFKEKTIEDKEENIGRRIALDMEGTPVGFKHASKIKNVAMLMASAVVDPTDMLTINFVASAKGALSAVDINVIRAYQLEDASDAVLLMLLYIDIPKSDKYAPGTQEFHAQAFLMVPNDSNKELIKVWESPDTILGYVSIQSAISGNLPNAFKTNTNSFFSGIRSSITRARREWDKLKGLSETELAKVQKEKELELIKKKQGQKKPTSEENKKKGQIFDFKLPGENDNPKDSPAESKE